VINSPALPPKHSVLGVGISATSYAEVTDICGAWVEQRRQGANGPAHFVTLTDGNGIVTGFFEKRFRQIVNSSDISTPDGMPVVWAMRSFGVSRQTRVYGPDLMLCLCERAASAGHRIFLYGARQDTLEALSHNLTRKFPGLTVCGMISPPFRPVTPEEDTAYVRQILDSGADIVFVGLGTPKQEAWMLAHRDKLPGLVLLSVGAAFDFHAGRIEQAPKWMQRSGLEWFFRLTREPRRLWKRYLVVVTMLPPLWALQKLRILRVQLPAEPRLLPTEPRL
jgi:N-acetylglucosaminyldiphosphoundecaprenol N-acetyl-beta-D-mannosaminyltransferase